MFSYYWDASALEKVFFDIMQQLIEKNERAVKLELIEKTEIIGNPTPSFLTSYFQQLSPFKENNIAQGKEDEKDYDELLKKTTALRL